MDEISNLQQNCSLYLLSQDMIWCTDVQKSNQLWTTFLQFLKWGNKSLEKQDIRPRPWSPWSPSLPGSSSVIFWYHNLLSSCVNWQNRLPEIHFAIVYYMAKWFRMPFRHANNDGGFPSCVCADDSNEFKVSPSKCRCVAALWSGKKYGSASPVGASHASPVFFLSPSKHGLRLLLHLDQNMPVPHDACQSCWHASLKLMHVFKGVNTAKGTKCLSAGSCT